MEKETLQNVSEWAQMRINSGTEPPWTLQNLKLLAEIAEEFALAMDSTVPYFSGLETSNDAAENFPHKDNVIQFKRPTKNIDDTAVNLPV